MRIAGSNLTQLFSLDLHVLTERVAFNIDYLEFIVKIHSMLCTCPDRSFESL